MPLLIVTVVSVFSTSSAQCASFSSNAGIFWLLPIKWYASVRMISGCGININSTEEEINATAKHIREVIAGL